MKKIYVFLALFCLVASSLALTQVTRPAGLRCTETATCPDGTQIHCWASGPNRSCTYSNGCVTCSGTDENGISYTTTDCCDGFEPGDIHHLE